MYCPAALHLHDTTAWSCKETLFSGHVQVDLIMMGERYRQLLDRGVDPWQPAQTERNAPSFADMVSAPRSLKLPSRALWCCGVANIK